MTDDQTRFAQIREQIRIGVWPADGNVCFLLDALDTRDGEIARLRADRDALRTLVDDGLDYVDHAATCIYLPDARPCTCGLLEWIQAANTATETP